MRKFAVGYEKKLSCDIKISKSLEKKLKRWNWAPLSCTNVVAKFTMLTNAANSCTTWPKGKMLPFSRKFRMFDTPRCFYRLYPTSSTACTLIAALCWSVTTVKIMTPQMEQFNSWIIHHKATAGHFARRYPRRRVKFPRVKRVRVVTRKSLRMFAPYQHAILISLVATDCCHGTIQHGVSVTWQLGRTGSMPAGNEAMLRIP